MIRIQRKHIVFLVILVTTLLLFLLVYWFVNKGKDNSGNQSDIVNAPQTPENSDGSVEDTRVIWGFNGTRWVPNGEAPECAEPFRIDSPVDLSKVTNILYPGQVRSGHFKAHGGFRFDNNRTTNVNVSLPIDATLISGSRYIEGGELQIILDFMSECGILVRFDHIAEVTPQIKVWVDQLPAPKVDDTRGTFFSAPQFFEKGTLVATKVGSATPLNVGVDFGLYDLRNENETSKNKAWAAKYGNESAQTFYGVCWLDYLVDKDRIIAKKLPGSGTEGRVSDYCN